MVAADVLMPIADLFLSKYNLVMVIALLALMPRVGIFPIKTRFSRPKWDKLG